MSEFPDGQADILQLLNEVVDRYSNKPVLSIFEAGKLTSVTYESLRQRVQSLAARLITGGVVHGDRVALLCDPSPQWAEVFFACFRSRCVLVPLDVKNSVAELKILIADCKPKYILASENYLETAQLCSLGEIPVITLTPAGQPWKGEIPMPPPRQLDDDILISYTSGTTGSPKGVRMTYRNLLSQVLEVEREMGVRPDDVFLSILPLNHLFELTCGLLSPLFHGAHVYYANSILPTEVSERMRSCRPTWMVTVPLFLKLLKSGIEKEIEKKSRLARFYLKIAFYVSGRIRVRSFRRLIFRPVHGRFGGRLRHLITGGAPLEADVEEFFERLGLIVLQGYGLTETSPIIAANTPTIGRKGSVGRPFERFEVKIAKTEGDIGEILTRGPHVMPGYYNRPDLTREVIDSEGWFHTGDLGRIDKDGFLYITGRIKNMIGLPGGKKVYPEEVESVLKNSPLFKEVCVLGTRYSGEGLLAGTEQVTAVIIPSGDQTFEDIENEVRRLSNDLSTFKRPTRIELHYGEFPKTAVKKVKRMELLALINQRTSC